jgi:hypothetical protein
MGLEVHPELWAITKVGEKVLGGNVEADKYLK